MSLSKPEKLFQEELTCLICMQVFSDPVVLPCGHSFCASCIGEVIEREAEKGQHTCPECRSEHKGKAALQRNVKLCNIVEGFKASECTSAYQVLCDMCLENALPAVKTCLKCEISLCALHLKRHGEKKTSQSHSLVDPTADLSARKCSLHDKPLEYYCVEDRSCICILCAFEGNHKNHNAKHLQTAHDEFRTTMEFQLKEITAKLNLSERLLQKGKEDETAVKAENAEMKQKAVELLDRLAELVANYKAHVIETIEAEQRPVVESLQQSIRRVTEQQSLLKHTQLQADSVWAERDEFLFIQKLLAIDPKLTEAIKEPLREPTAKCLNRKKVFDYLEKKNTEFQADTARIQKGLQALIIPPELTFDPNTVHPNLILSADLKTARYSSVKQPYPNHPERFSSFQQVLCFQGYSSGEHRWEVETTVECEWTLGVCYRSICKTGLGSALESNRFSWCLLWSNKKLSASDMGKCTLLLNSQPITVEVHLNYDAGTLSFHSVSGRRVHLHTINTTFTEPVYPSFRVISCSPSSWVSLCSSSLNNSLR